MDQSVALSSLWSWLEVDLQSLAYNIRTIRKKVGPSNRRILTVLKSNAYGHGIIPLGKACADAGVDFLGIGNVQEGLLLRAAGILKPVLILAPLVNQDVEEVVASDLTPTISSLEMARRLSVEAVKQEKIVNVHVEIDTGMSRFGFDAGSAAYNIKHIQQMSGLRLEGIWSHLANALEEAPTLEQLRLFNRTIQEVDLMRIKIPIKHIAASSAILKWPTTYMDMVRPGLILYGLCPPGVNAKEFLTLRPVMSLKSRILFLKELREGSAIGYGSTFKAVHQTTIAILPIGFADGYSRKFSNKAFAFINGIRAPIIGNICMNQTTIDVTAVPSVHVGQEVTLFGGAEGGTSINKAAEQTQLIPNEIVCGLSERIPRVYINGNDISHEIN